MLSTIRPLALSRLRCTCTAQPRAAATRRFSSSKDTTLTKADLIQILSKEYDMTAAQSSRVLDTVLDTIVEAVSKSHTVSIGNFGKFETITSPARMYNNPITKQPVWKEEIRRVKFRPFTNFKECVHKKSG